MRMSEREKIIESMFEDATEELYEKIDDCVYFFKAEEPDMYDTFQIICEECGEILEAPDFDELVALAEMTGWGIFRGGLLCPKCLENEIDDFAREELRW